MSQGGRNKMSFRGKFVDYYEIFFADKKFDDLSIKVIELCKKYINDFEYILDFGCGTGVFDIRFAKEGYSVYGVDISRDMIKYAKEHNFLNNKIKYINGDIRNIKIDKIFDVVCALSHVICYQVSNESLMGVFMNAYKHLRRGGIFIFDVYHQAAIMKNGFESRIKKVENKGVRITRFSNIKNYSIESYFKVYYQYLIEDNCSPIFLRMSDKMRYFSIKELDFYLRVAGFSRVDFMGDILLRGGGGKINEKMNNIYVVAVK
ncbi:class I SAM-dependent DNA methyltransferase [Helicobacter pullorum]|uniref:class I SAM-dependent DNA methyltransferase n=2 Tax=Helicobacter pullorum TaxID=35818 RepID=UPI00242E4FE3|nr:class I SAM-dependent methyltransferase [Helicobacter pullorum]